MKKGPGIKVALLGIPNCGKSSLFNALTGLKQSTANFPGATVEKKSGHTEFSGADGTKTRIELVDLPGTYSLHPSSPDEEIAVRSLLDPSDSEHPDAVMIVVDGTNLKRGLFLATQIIDQKLPVVIALNMMDLVERRGYEIDIEKLKEKLGVEVVPVSARKGSGVEQLKKVLSGSLAPASKKILDELPNQEQGSVAQERFRLIGELLQECLSSKPKDSQEQFTSKADAILTHKVWGFLIFLTILFLLFEAIFFISAYPMEWIERSFIFLSQWGASNLPEGEFSDLLVNGVLAGLSGVVVFIPQIATLFLFIALLEDSGYMARASFITDRLMRRFGLNGRSVIPLLSGVACAVPAIMGARSISNWKERLVTMLVIPLMSCSARLPVYTLIIALVIPSERVLYIFNWQGITLMILYLLGFLAAIGSAWLFKFFIRSKEKSYFIMELPPYRSPSWGNVLITIFDRVKIFLWDAGKIIVAISIVLWFLAAHGPGDELEKIDAKYDQMEADADTEAARGSEKLKASYAGMMGRTLEPVIEPLGFDWKVGIALITSFAAREVFVGTMATIYSVGDESNERSIREKMAMERHEVSGEKKYSLATGISLMLFYAFAMQCMSTLAVVKRETGSWKWPILQFVFYSLLAYGASYFAFNVFS